MMLEKAEGRGSIHLDQVGGVSTVATVWSVSNTPVRLTRTTSISYSMTPSAEIGTSIDLRHAPVRRQEVAVPGCSGERVEEPAPRRLRRSAAWLRRSSESLWCRCTVSGFILCTMLWACAAARPECRGRSRQLLLPRYIGPGSSRAQVHRAEGTPIPGRECHDGRLRCRRPRCWDGSASRQPVSFSQSDGVRVGSLEM